MVETILDGVWLLADILLLLALLDSSGLLQQTLLLLGLALGAVLVKELEGLGGGVAVENVLELCDRRWDLQSEVEDLLLALETDILGPLHHTRKVSSWLDVLTDTEVTAALLNERVLASRQLNSIAWDWNMNIPLGPSWILHQPWTGGMAPGQPSFRWLWEAIIEKRKTSANMFTNNLL